MNASHTQQKDSYESFEVKNEMKGKEYVGVIFLLYIRPNIMELLRRIVG